MDKLKEYAKYLLTEYVEINDFYEDSRMYWELQNFISYGTIKYLIESTDTYEHMVDVLKSYHNSLVTFINESRYDIKVKTFEEYFEE